MPAAAFCVAVLFSTTVAFPFGIKLHEDAAEKPLAAAASGAVDGLRPHVDRGGDNDAGADPTSLDPDMTKLNEYLMAEKANSINVEGLYGDLQKRFNALKQEWVRAETERNAMRKALRGAQASAQRLSTQNERLTAVLTEVHHEQDRMQRAKSTVMQALGLNDALNITDILAHP